MSNHTATAAAATATTTHQHGNGDVNRIRLSAGKVKSVNCISHSSVTPFGVLIFDADEFEVV